MLEAIGLGMIAPVDKYNIGCLRFNMIKVAKIRLKTVDLM